MLRNRLIWTCLLAVAAALAVGSRVRADDEKKPSQQDGGADLEIGQPAPEFTLKNFDGKEVKLADYKDKVVVLEWISKDCPVCKQYCNAMKASASKYADKGVVWLAIDSTHFHKADDNVAYAKDKGIKYPILSDFDGAVGKQYRAKTTPHMYVINKGKLAYRGAIADERDGKNYVELAVDALLAGKPVATEKTQPFG